MPTYEVSVRRSEIITFHVEADDADAAWDAYLLEGDEIGSYSDPQPEVLDVRELPERKP